MTKLIGLSGSLRKASFNSALLRAAVQFAPAGVELSPWTIRGIPLYDADVEAEKGVPEAVEALKDAIAQADGLLLVTPEYNNSIPGVFKNAIDWLSRPPGDIPRVFGGKPVAVLSDAFHAFSAVGGVLATTPMLLVAAGGIATELIALGLLYERHGLPPD